MRRAMLEGLLLLTIAAGLAGAVEPGCPAPLPGTNIVNGVGYEMDDVSDLPAGTKTASYGLVNECSYDGTIVIAGPLSLTEGDAFYSYSMMIQRTLMIYADYVNLERGGLRVGDQRYGLRFVWVDDRSSTAMAPNASTTALRSSGADFAWAGYGSGPSREVAKQAFADDKLFFAGCASSPTVFAQNDQSFGSLPPVGKFLANPLSAIKHAADAIDTAGVPSRCGRNNPDGCAGSIKVGFIQAAASFTRGICSTGESDVLSRGMTVSSVGVLEVAQVPTVDAVKQALRQLIDDGVNVVAGCTYEGTGRAILTALEELDFSPLALILTTTVTQPSYADDVLRNSWWQGEYVIGPTPWHRNSPIVGEFSGKTSTWFFEEYKARFEDSAVAYQGVSNFGLASALGAAIEAAGTLEKEAVKAALYDLDLQEFYGHIQFTETGQVSFDMIVVQYAPNKDEEDIVYPLEATTGGTFLFPTPTWAQRRCWHTEKLWALERNNDESAYECDGAGLCNEEGSCTCNEGFSGTHCEVNSIMTECPAGAYAIQMDPLICRDCPDAAVSAPGSTSVEDCTPRLQVAWVACEPCATHSVEGEDCGICPAGYILSSDGGQYEDYDECSIDNGGCDPLAEPICTNLEGSYECGQCPSGFLGDGNLANGGCTLPAPEMTHGGELSGSPVVPTSTINATTDVAALDNVTILVEALQSGLADTLNITAGVVVTNLRPIDSTVGRRLQSTTLTTLVQFEIGLTGTTGPAAMKQLQAQMANSDFCTAMSFVPGQELSISYTCPIGMVRFEGQTLCTKCPYPEFTPDQETCEACPLNMEPDATGAGCQCKDNHYSAINFDGSERELTCNARSYVPSDGEEDNLGGVRLVCKPNDLPCVSACRGMDVSLKPGWTAKDIGDGQSAYFLCNGGAEACPGGSVANLTCGAGYTGTLCSACASGYHDAAGNSCKPCSEQTAAGVLAIFFGLMIVAFLASKVRLWYNYFTIFTQIAEQMQELQLKAIGKQLMATMQILSGLGPVLDIVFPPSMAKLLNSIASFFKIDIGQLFGLGCFTVSSYATSLLLNFGVVLLLVIIISGLYWYQYRALMYADDEEKERQARAVFEKFDRQGDGSLAEDEVKQICLQIDPNISDEAAKQLFDLADAGGSKDGRIDFDEFMVAVKSEHTEEFSLDDLILAKQKFDLNADALGRFFLLVFVMYPGLTNKVFECFMCRNLGDVWVLHTDYSVQCYTTSWYGMAFVCGILVILWPIGLPAFLFYRMKKQLHLIRKEDEDTLRFWDFALGDYDIDHWYWECVELSRKMIMAGLLGLLGRGSIKQVAAAVITSFIFFAVALKEQPFESRGLNLVKVASEFQLFVVLLSCLVIQTDVRGLTYQNTTDIGTFQAGCTFAALPLVAYVVSLNLKAAKEETALALGDKSAVKNPMHDAIDVKRDADGED